MAIYAVYVPPETEPGDADRVVFVRDGFSVVALLFGPLWLLVHRFWLGLVGWLVVSAAIAAIAGALHQDGLALSVLFAFWLGLEASAIHRWTLERRGYDLAAVVEGGDRDAVERRFFSHWAQSVVRADIRPPSNGRAARSDDSIIGLFPARAVSNPSGLEGS
jgi:hypothetical protein